MGIVLFELLPVRCRSRARIAGDHGRASFNRRARSRHEQGGAAVSLALKKVVSTRVEKEPESASRPPRVSRGGRTRPRVPSETLEDSVETIVKSSLDSYARRVGEQDGRRPAPTLTDTLTRTLPTGVPGAHRAGRELLERVAEKRRRGPPDSFRGASIAVGCHGDVKQCRRSGPDDDDNVTSASVTLPNPPPPSRPWQVLRDRDRESPYRKLP